MDIAIATVRGYVQGMHQHWLAARLREANVTAQSTSLVTIETRYRYNPDVRSLPAMVPASIPIMLMMIPAIQADPAADLGNLSELSLTELIIHTGIHDAIARKLNQREKLSRNAISEGIINNVRKTIIRDQLTDPRFYAEISTLLEDLSPRSARALCPTRSS